MKKFDTCYCDLDGVIADFHLEAVRAHMREGKQFKLDHYGTPLELTHDHLYSRFPPGISVSQYCLPDLPREVLEDHWHGAMDLFWAPIRKDPFFWKNMPPLPWWKDLIKLLHQYSEEIVFFTTPDKHENSYGGKFYWMKRHGLGDYELLTGKNKWRLVDPNCILIDDFGVHVANWLNKCKTKFNQSGHAILFPQPWNDNHVHCHNRLGTVQ